MAVRGSRPAVYSEVNGMERTPMFHWLSMSHMLNLDPITLSGEFNALIGFSSVEGLLQLQKQKVQRVRDRVSGG